MNEAGLVRAVNDLPASLPGVLEVTPHNSSVQLKLAAGTTPQDVLRALVERNIALEQFEIAMPTLDEIFIHVVQSSQGENHE